MNVISKTITAFSAVILTMLLTACSPEVGSKEWCDALKEKPKGDWTSNEVADYAKHCIFK